MVNKIYKGWNVDINKGTGATLSTTLGAAQSVSVEVSASLDPVYGVGHLNPVELKQGPREISGSVERMYGDEELWDIINPTGTSQSYLSMEADMKSGERVLRVNGVKFDSWSVDIPQDDFLTESADFTATEITVSGTDVAALPLSSPEQSSEPSFICESCGDSFDTERGLRVHERVHTKEEEGE